MISLSPIVMVYPQIECHIASRTKRARYVIRPDLDEFLCPAASSQARTCFTVLSKLFIVDLSNVPIRSGMQMDWLVGRKHIRHTVHQQHSDLVVTLESQTIEQRWAHIVSVIPLGWDCHLTRWFEAKTQDQTWPQLTVDVEVLDVGNVLRTSVKDWIVQVGQCQIFFGLETEIFVTEE